MDGGMDRGREGWREERERVKGREGGDGSRGEKEEGREGE